MSSLPSLRYRVHDLTDFSVYEVSHWTKAKGFTAKSAVREAMKQRDIITMGKIIVEPIKEK